MNMVMIGGDVTYARQEWIEQITAHQLPPRLRPVIAWGKQMLLDNGYRSRPDEDEVPTLDDLRADLISVFPHLGPIWY